MMFPQPSKGLCLSSIIGVTRSGMHRAASGRLFIESTGKIKGMAGSLSVAGEDISSDTTEPAGPLKPPQVARKTSLTEDCQNPAGNYQPKYFNTPNNYNEKR